MPLRQALHRALIAREISKRPKATVPTGYDGTVGNEREIGYSNRSRCVVIVGVGEQTQGRNGPERKKDTERVNEMSPYSAEVGMCAVESVDEI